MSGVPYIRFYGDDWLSGTQELSLEERGALVTIVALTSSTGAPPQADYDRLARRFGCTPGKAKKIIATLVDLGKIQLADGALENRRALAELENSQKNSEKQSENANARWSKKTGKSNKNNGATDTAAMPRECQPEPEPEPYITDTNVSVGTPEKKKPARRTQLSADWSPSPKNNLDAENAGLSWQDVNREAQQFADYHHSRASLMANWDAAWRTWCRNAVKFAARRGGASDNQESDLQRISRMANEALREGKLQ